LGEVVGVNRDDICLAWEARAKSEQEMTMPREPERTKTASYCVWEHVHDQLLRMTGGSVEALGADGTWKPAQSLLGHFTGIGGDADCRDISAVQASRLERILGVPDRPMRAPHIRRQAKPANCPECDRAAVVPFRELQPIGSSSADPEWVCAECGCEVFRGA